MNLDYELSIQILGVVSAVGAVVLVALGIRKVILEKRLIKKKLDVHQQLENQTQSARVVAIAWGKYLEIRNLGSSPALQVALAGCSGLRLVEGQSRNFPISRLRPGARMRFRMNRYETKEVFDLRLTWVLEDGRHDGFEGSVSRM